MLIHPTIDKLNSMRLTGMAKGFRAQLESPEIHNLPFEDRLALIVDLEFMEREQRQLATRLKSAKMRQNAVLEDLDTKASRGIDRSLLASLTTCQWVKKHHNLLITGATGAGKTWLSCAYPTPPAARGSPPFITDSRHSCRTWNSHATTAATQKSCGRSPKPNS
jgi:DNA replication protein DnaC